MTDSYWMSIDGLTETELRLMIPGSTRMNRACCLAYLRNRSVLHAEVTPALQLGRPYTVMWPWAPTD
jgi:hypothetical protein